MDLSPWLGGCGVEEGEAGETRTWRVGLLSAVPQQPSPQSWRDHRSSHSSPTSWRDPERPLALGDIKPQEGDLAWPGLAPSELGDETQAPSRSSQPDGVGEAATGQ